MKLVELNLFVWILYYSWDHYIGDKDKEMEKNVLPKFDCFSYPATIGPPMEEVVNFIRTVRRQERAYYKRKNHSSN